MAAGLGYKEFAVGEVLSASNVNGYLMQGVLVFADATARDAAITSPQEGQFAFTKNNDSLWYYSGSAWVSSGATGDIEGVTAGVGISGGGTSGTVTVTNSMATAIDAKGDLIAGTGADTFARLAVGTNGHTLVADSATATGLKWAAPAGGAGLTKITSATFSAVSSVSFPDNTFTSTYKDYLVQFNVTNVSANTNFQARMRASGSDNTATEYFDATLVLTMGNTSANRANGNQNKFNLGYANSGTDQFSRAFNFISPQIATRTRIWGGGLGVTSDYVTNTENDTQLLHHNVASSFDSFTFIASGGTMTGYYAVYGLEA